MNNKYDHWQTLVNMKEKEQLKKILRVTFLLARNYLEVWQGT